KVAERRDPIAEQHHCQRGWRSEADPGGERARDARAQHPDGDANLAAGRPRQKLTERDDVGVACFVEPFAAGHGPLPPATHPGPPNEVTPSLRNAANTCAAEPRWAAPPEAVSSSAMTAIL